MWRAVAEVKGVTHRTARGAEEAHFVGLEIRLELLLGQGKKRQGKARGTSRSHETGACTRGRPWLPHLCEELLDPFLNGVEGMAQATGQLLLKLLHDVVLALETGWVQGQRLSHCGRHRLLKVFLVGKGWW